MSYLAVLLPKRGCFSSTGAATVEGLFLRRPPYVGETRDEEDRKEADERAEEAFQEALVCDVGGAGDDDNDDDGKF